MKNTTEKETPATVAIDLVSQIDQGRGKQNQEDGGEADRDLGARDGNVWRNLPAPLTFVLEAKNEHGQAVEGEAPDHAEGVGFAQEVNVAATGDDGEKLQQHDQLMMR